MSSLFPTEVGFSLAKLARHGGAEGPHRDGWGVAFYAERDALLLREPCAASESGLIRYIERNAPPSDLVISHIRYASSGVAALRNTQPFLRELGGRAHVFAHNGDLPGLLLRTRQAKNTFQPIGEADSERAFCLLMNRLRDIWVAAGDEPPTLEARAKVFSVFCREIRGEGSANVIYSDSQTLFVHAHCRTEPGSDDPLPGAYMLTRSCEETVPDLRGAGISLRTGQQALTLLASVPLTVEDWQPLQSGEVLAIESGAVVWRGHT